MPLATRTQYLADLGDLLRKSDAGDTAEATRRADALDRALREYSRDRPRELRIPKPVIAGTEGAPVMKLGVQIEETYGGVLRVEAPALQIPPAVLHADDWELVDGAAQGWLVVLSQDAVTIGTQGEAVYGGVHEITATESTVPEADGDAVLQLAAAYIFDQLAADAADDIDGTIQAAAIDREDVSSRYRKLAADARKRYREMLGISARPDTRPKPASATATFRRRRPLDLGRVDGRV